MYIKILWDDFENFMRERRFIRVYPHRWKEAAFGKFFVEKERMILVGSTFDAETQREYGSDAIRTQLRHGNSEDKNRNQKILWTMKATKRMPNWQIHSGRKIDTMEIAVDATPQCPKCGRWMILKTAKNRWAFWGCLNHPQCKGTRRLTSALRHILRKNSDDWEKPQPQITTVSMENLSP